MSFSKDIHFSSVPKGFEVSSFGKPPVDWNESKKLAQSEYSKGREETEGKFNKQLTDFREDLAKRQSDLLLKIQEEANSTLAELENRLPDLLIGLFEHVLPGLELDGKAVEQTVRSLIKEFSDETESLEVYLCLEDLNLLKGVNNPDRKSVSSESLDDEDAFAGAISGIFDNLDGDDSLLPDYPNVRFHEDPSLSVGDCQIKSRFGLLDGRIATKLRRVESSMSQNG